MVTTTETTETAGRMLDRLFAALLPRHNPPPPKAEDVMQLAVEIADEAARCEIESYCIGTKMGLLNWYDTDDLCSDTPEVADGIDKALRYLKLREQIILHPHHAHFVRFPTAREQQRSSGAAS